MQSREELIKGLEKLRWEQASRIFRGETPGLIEEIADFILEDRKKICEPLIAVKEVITGDVCSHNKQAVLYSIAVDKAINLAGLGE